MIPPHTTLEQWRALIAVVDSGGYAQAAEALHKSQSAVTYAVKNLQQVLGVRAFEIQGRKAVLTPTGKLLYRRARALLDDAGGLERAARTLSAGWEAEIRVTVEDIFPTWLILQCFDRLATESPHTRIELVESVISGAEEALVQGRTDLAISPTIPAGFSGDPLMRVRFVPVAHPDHPLHRLGRDVTMHDLRAHRQVILRETGSQDDHLLIGSLPFFLGLMEHLAQRGINCPLPVKNRGGEALLGVEGRDPERVLDKPGPAKIRLLQQRARAPRGLEHIAGLVALRVRPPGIDHPPDLLGVVAPRLALASQDGLFEHPHALPWAALEVGAGGQAPEDEAVVRAVDVEVEAEVEVVAVVRRDELRRDQRAERGVRWARTVLDRDAADAFGDVDARETDLHADRAVLREDPVDHVVVVADGGDHPHHELDLGAALV